MGKRQTRTVAAAARRQLTKAKLGHCAQCGMSQTFLARDLVVDHKIPLADGGADTHSNLQYLCRRHHLEKTSAEATARIQ